MAGNLIAVNKFRLAEVDFYAFQNYIDLQFISMSTKSFPCCCTWIEFKWNE